MCSICGIKYNTTVGSVVKIVRRCQSRTPKDKGKHLADKQSLIYVTKIATRGEGFYGQMINLEESNLQKTNAHFRDCEFEATNYIWENNKLI
ncbi:hypothetical protein ABE288_20490 [Bacillus salipaludis]|uniref:hypothetical protein n=1 Tax=Bacillus salipaludis TaxID=2547811 RepID=UPI003D1C8A6F